MEEEHSQALESSANKIAVVKKELETLQQETGKLRSVAFPLIHTFYCVTQAAPTLHYTAGKFEITALFLRLSLPSTLIRRENGAFRKRSSNRRNLKTPALRFSCKQKKLFKNRVFRRPHDFLGRVVKRKSRVTLRRGVNRNQFSDTFSELPVIAE